MAALVLMFIVAAALILALGHRRQSGFAASPPAAQRQALAFVMKAEPPDLTPDDLSQIESRLRFSQLTACYCAGNMAYPSRECPYLAGSEEAKHWAAGWEVAEAGVRLSDPSRVVKPQDPHRRTA
jgi:hypothetical protein